MRYRSAAPSAEHAAGSGSDDPRPGSFASSGFQKAKLLERRDAIVETDLFRDLATLDTEYGCPGEPHLATGRRRKRAAMNDLCAAIIALGLAAPPWVGLTLPLIGTATMPARTPAARADRIAAECTKGVDYCDELALAGQARLLGLRVPRRAIAVKRYLAAVAMCAFLTIGNLALAENRKYFGGGSESCGEWTDGRGSFRQQAL